MHVEVEEKVLHVDNFCSTARPEKVRYDEQGGRQYEYISSRLISISVRMKRAKGEEENPELA